MIALQQTNLRRLLAYASISHVGLVIVGIATLNMQGIQGAIFQLLNFTLIASCLILIAGFYTTSPRQYGTYSSWRFGKSNAPADHVLFLFAMASMGVPGTSGFPAEMLLIIGALTATRDGNCRVIRCYSRCGLYVVFYSPCIFLVLSLMSR